ncbi:cyclase family protein [Flavivirga abyssicola]|uniref:cyclase family protein n=1 Tax=Flavivirga abyssicola TaxID=3063533 RepID=UPI0026DEA5FB|nr:cyclase family protein [Flavivirga sp. MEBiC07777]WVK11638.1 cyclase family protein [Flavivirga sp. MEBiC07777]
MIATIQYNSKKLQIDLSLPIDISIPLRASESNVNAWYIDAPVIEPVKDGERVVSVEEGACVNFNNISFNPHAHGTHTECVGHITKKVHSVNKNLKQFFFLAEVITVAPEKLNDDFVISKKQLRFAIGNKKRDAIIIRTIPNTKEKLTAQYSHTNPPYLLEDAATYLREKDVKHVLVDMPSVDKEKDECALLAHSAFWNTKGKIRLDATITEFIFVPNTVEDGMYFLNLQIAPFENDASPSKPVLYKIMS